MRALNDLERIYNILQAPKGQQFDQTTRPTIERITEMESITPAQLPNYLVSLLDGDKYKDGDSLSVFPGKVRLLSVRTNDTDEVVTVAISIGNQGVWKLILTQVPDHFLGLLQTGTDIYVQRISGKFMGIGYDGDPNALVMSEVVLDPRPSRWQPIGIAELERDSWTNVVEKDDNA